MNAVELAAFIKPDKEYRITVTVDTNDGDYMTESSRVSGGTLLDHLIPVVYALRNPKKPSPKYHNYNWWAHEWTDREITPQEMYDLTKENFAFVDSITPYSEGGFHTIEDIFISEWTSEVRVF